jgi:hypothetical protein
MKPKKTFSRATEFSAGLSHGLQQPAMGQVRAVMMMMS